MLVSKFNKIKYQMISNPISNQRDL
jgi:hypothetical protein